MDDAPGEEERRKRRVMRSAAAFMVLLDNLGTETNPSREDPEKIAEMSAIIEEGAREAEQDPPAQG